MLKGIIKIIKAIIPRAKGNKNKDILMIIIKSIRIMAIIIIIIMMIIIIIIIIIVIIIIKTIIIKIIIIIIVTMMIIQWKLPVVDIPNSGHAMNSGQNI